MTKLSQLPVYTPLASDNLLALRGTSDILVNAGAISGLTNQIPVVNQTLATIAAQYPAANYAGFYAYSSDQGLVASNGVRWYAAIPTVNVVAFGADPTGVADSTAAITAAAAAGKSVVFPAGTYLINGTPTIPAGVDLIAQSGASFTGATGVGIFNSYNTTPVGFSENYTQSIDSTFNSYGNFFNLASQITSTSTAPAVAVYGSGIGAGASSKVWGANFAVILTNAGATGIGCEIDVNMPAAGAGTGLSVNAVGANAGISALQLNSNTISNGWLYGVNFNNTTHTAVGGINSCLLRSLNSASAYGINFTGSFTTAELNLPSFVVGATPASINSAVQVLGSAAALPSISAVGAATNIQLTLNAKGSGQVAVGSPLNLGAAASTNSSGVTLGSSTQTTIGANGAASALTANPLGYLIGYIGSTKIAIPYYNG